LRKHARFLFNKSKALVRLKIFFIAIAASLLTAALLSCSAQAQKARTGAHRQVAVTIDDLPAPFAGLPARDVGTLRENTVKLLKSITANKVPVIGFVNEDKIAGRVDSAERTAVLQMWLDANLELGNHTFSHPSLERTPLEEYEQNVIRGETLLKSLLGARHQTLRYFRHPFLHVGPNLETRRAFEKFLVERGYTIAPVTIDDDDYMFALVYAKAKERGDTAMMKRVADAYIPYMDGMFDFYERLSVNVVGREIKQVLLIHANALNADHFDELVAMMRKRGYSFVTLEQALRDKAYDLPDTYSGPYGISWLHHWALTRGLKRRPSPDPPDFITKQYESLSQAPR
jgi:peptidoglycan/xylan/chitin deacetylase (PgdA/CDA1 family)